MIPGDIRYHPQLKLVLSQLSTLPTRGVIKRFCQTPAHLAAAMAPQHAMKIELKTLAESLILKTNYVPG